MTEKIYCVRCKDKIDIDSPKEFVMSNGNLGLLGICPICNANVYKTISKYRNKNKNERHKIYSEMKKQSYIKKEEERIKQINEYQKQYKKIRSKPIINPNKIIEHGKQSGLSEEVAIAFVLNGELLDAELKKKGIILGD